MDQSHEHRSTLILTVLPSVIIRHKSNRPYHHTKFAFVLVLSKDNHLGDLLWGQHEFQYWGENETHALPDRQDPFSLKPESQSLQANEEKTVIQVDPFAFESKNLH